MMDWFETAFGAHYRTLYSHRDDAEALRFIRTLDRTLPPTRWPMLDLGCGDGRHMAALQETGGTVLGLDLSPHLLADAAVRGLGGRLIRGDMRSLPLADGSIQTVLSLFTAFGYFGDLAAHASMIRGISRILAPGGIWVLDYLNCGRVLRYTAGGTDSRQAGPLLVEETRTLDAMATKAGGMRRVKKDVLLTARKGHEAEAAAMGIGARGLSYTESVALFKLSEIDEMARSAKLRRVDSMGDYDGSPLKANRSPRWILYFRKEEG